MALQSNEWISTRIACALADEGLCVLSRKGMTQSKLSGITESVETILAAFGE